MSPPFNTLSMEKLKEVVASAKKTNKWQPSKEGEPLKEDSLKDRMFSRPLVLRPIYWKISSDAYTNFKMEYEEEMNQRYLECANTKFQISSSEVPHQP